VKRVWEGPSGGSPFCTFQVTSESSPTSFRLSENQWREANKGSREDRDSGAKLSNVQVK